MNLPSEQSRTFRDLAQGIRDLLCGDRGETSACIVSSFQAPDIPQDSANVDQVSATHQALGLGLRILR